MKSSSRAGEIGSTLAAGLVGLALVLALRALLVRDMATPNRDFLPDMAYSPAVKSQSLRDGAETDRGLPEGVVPRGQLPFRYGPGPEEAKRAGAEFASPFKASDAAALARGAEVYRVFCAVCHGTTGEGDGPVVLRGMIRPPSLLAARAVGIADGEAFHIVTRGQGNMASYAAQVAPDDRWKAILHVRVLQKGAAR